MIAERQKLNGAAPIGDNLLVTADAFSRHGQYADAAETLRVAVVKDPSNGDAWLSLANALVQHAEGNLSPAALFAFGRAMQASSNHPGPPFFLGLALARSGRLQEGRAIWADLLARTPQQAPWRADLTAQLADLDAFIARQETMIPPR
jgi:cytochrome c-type biogenesis protein CcmH